MEDKKYERGTIGWFREQAKKDGFGNIGNWQSSKKGQRQYKELEEKYGKEFADWARKNPDDGNNWRRKKNQIKRRKELRNSLESEYRKDKKGTLGWLREQQKIKAKKDGFDNIDDWLKWKVYPFNILEKRYGKEFADWARENKDKVPKWYLDSGCKTDKEYQNKKARDAGFKDWNERQREYRYETGQCLPSEVNEDCSIHFGKFVENIMIHYYPGAIKMPSNNPGFDYFWKDENGKDIKINSKGRCLYYFEYGLPVLIFPIDWNNMTDIFILSGWDNRESKNPLFALEFHKNDLIKYGRGTLAPKVEFWKRDSIGITYPEGLEEFRDYQIDIGWMKDFIDDK